MGGFTLIEIVLVITVMGVVMAVAGNRFGTFTYLREENFLRIFAERLDFLHSQSVSEQAFYQVEFDFDSNSYRVGILRSESDVAEGLESAGDVGVLTLELSDYLNPSMGESQTIIPPPTFPSLAEPQPLPPGVKFTRIRTMRGVKKASEGGKMYMVISPRGFSEFAVINLNLSSGQPITFVVNPFTGTPEMLRSEEDFEYTYGRKKN